MPALLTSSTVEPSSPKSDDLPASPPVSEDHTIAPAPNLPTSSLASLATTFALAALSERYRFTQYSNWIQIIKSDLYFLNGHAIGPAYKLFLQHQVLLHVASDLGLNPAQFTGGHIPILSTTGTHGSISVNDVLRWSGRAPGTYRNKRRLMCSLQMAIEDARTEGLLNSTGSTASRHQPLLLFSSTPAYLSTIQALDSSISWNYVDLQQYLVNVTFI